MDIERAGRNHRVKRTILTPSFFTASLAQGGLQSRVRLDQIWPSLPWVAVFIMSFNISIDAMEHLHHDNKRNVIAHWKQLYVVVLTHIFHHPFCIHDTYSDLRAGPRISHCRHQVQNHRPALVALRGSSTLPVSTRGETCLRGRPCIRNHMGPVHERESTFRWRRVWPK